MHQFIFFYFKGALFLFTRFPFLETGCRKFYPSQWTYEWTSEFGQQEWSNFADAWAACKSIDCGSIGLHLIGGSVKKYYLRKGADRNSEGPIPNESHAGCWVKITDTRSTYCDA